MILLKDKKNKGFTLLEILIVIALSSLVLLGVFQGFFILKHRIENYYQTIRLQNNLKFSSYEFYKIIDNAGKFGCATTMQPLYLHLSKTVIPALSPLLFFTEKKWVSLKFIKKSDFLVKSLLSQAVYGRLKPESDLIYALHANQDNSEHKEEIYPIYADCRDVFVLSALDPREYFLENTQFSYIGNLSVNLYFVAKSKRKNSQGIPIDSLYRYNQDLGAQEVLEGVELIQADTSNPKKINILVNSVEGKLPLKQWFTVVI